MVSGNDLGVIAIIGIVLLIGIVKKNAIMMIDFALDAERQEGKSPREAIHQAALLRFRPILMTTLAALFGALPLMLGWGMGSELRHPLGISIVGGLIRNPALTLSTTAFWVAAPLERRLGHIADVSEMTSSSSTGSTRVILQFGLGRDIDGAARDVQAAINAARADLPSTLRSNPTYRKVNPADSPIL